MTLKTKNLNYSTLKTNKSKVAHLRRKLRSPILAYAACEDVLENEGRWSNTNPDCNNDKRTDVSWHEPFPDDVSDDDRARIGADIDRIETVAIPIENRLKKT